MILIEHVYGFGVLLLNMHLVHQGAVYVCFFKTVQQGRPPLWYFIKIKKIETELYKSTGMKQSPGSKKLQMLHMVTTVQC